MSYVASIASHPARFKFLTDSLPTIEKQTITPEHFVLYIAKEHQNYLRPTIIQQFPKTLEVVFLERNLRPANKLLPALKEFDFPIVTFDDDIYHHPGLSERLLTEHEVFPDALIANVALEIKFIDKEIAPFKTWKSRVPSLGYPSPFLLHASGHGTLFHRNHFVKDVYDEDTYERLSHSRADAWFHFHSVRNGSYTHVLPNNIDTKSLEIPKSQNVGALHRENRSKHNKIFAGLEQEYGSLWNIMEKSGRYRNKLLKKIKKIYL